MGADTLGNLNKRFDSLESAVLKLRNDLSRKEPRIEVIRRQVTVTKDPIENLLIMLSRCV